MEYRVNYPFSVIKICTIPHVIEKYVPASLNSNNTEVGESSLSFSDLLFGSDILNEVYILKYKKFI